MKPSTVILLGMLALFLVGGGAIVAELAMWKKANNAQAYLPLLADAESRYGIPPDLLARLAYQESRFREDIADGSVNSPAGAVGLMQMLPQYFPGPLTNPAFAIDTAARYLRQLYDRFGSWQLAAAAYNAGPGTVSKYGGVPPFAETQNYVAQIFGDLPQTSLYA